MTDTTRTAHAIQGGLAPAVAPQQPLRQPHRLRPHLHLVDLIRAATRTTTSVMTARKEAHSTAPSVSGATQMFCPCGCLPVW